MVPTVESLAVRLQEVTLDIAILRTQLLTAMEVLAQHHAIIGCVSHEE